MPTQRERIEQWSLGYHLLKYYVDFCTRTYFKTTIVGKEKINFNEVLIFAANHQNALADALVILAAHNWQPVFLARADIFKNPTVAKILTFIKILPVFRIRDGFSSLQNNDEIFLKTMDVLKNRNGLVLMPEGNHGDKRTLRQLKKGIARIAFQAEEASENTLKIKIIPVGLEYSEYRKFRSKLLIRFGEPIEVSKYLQLYKENQAMAYNALLDEYTEKIIPQMIYIKDDENYFNYESLRKIYSPNYIQRNTLTKNHNTIFETDKTLIAHVDKMKVDYPEKFKQLMERIEEYIKDLNKGKLKPEQYPYKLNILHFGFKVLLLLATFPLMIYGLINNIIPVYFSFNLSKKFKDLQFHSSVKLGAGIVLFPIVHFIQIILFLIFSGSGLFTLGYIISLPISAFILYNWRRYAYSIVADLKIIKAKFKLQDLRVKHEAICKMVEI